MNDWRTCVVGSCQRHQECMYSVCRNRSSPVLSVARRQGKTLALAQSRLRAVGKGATINGTYRLPPSDALEAFRKDLLLIVGEQ